MAPVPERLILLYESKNTTNIEIKGKDVLTVCLLAQIMEKFIIRSLSVQCVNNTDKDFKSSESDT